MDNICKICNKEIVERSHYWKTHKIKESDYYQKFYNKKDLLTQDLIPFKNPEQYFNSDFIDKNNLKKYLQMVSKEEGLNYLKTWMQKRKEIKKLIYSPSNFELRTLCYPSIKFIHKFYGIGSYELMCLQLGLLTRYNYEILLEFSDSSPTIQVDTRESNPLKFKNEIEIIKLDFADYAPQENPYKIYIERKSLTDFISSISSGFERLYREIERAQNDKANIIIVIESKINNLFGFNKLKYIHSEASVDFILKRSRDLLLKFPNVQICCVDGRIEAAKFIDKIFRLKTNPAEIDIQYKIDKGEL